MSRSRSIAWLVACAMLAPAAWGDLQGFDPHAVNAPDFKLTPFYEVGLDYVGKHPGDVIRTEVIPAPAGAVAWRVMYVSRTWDDRLVPVSGIIVAPKGAAAKDRVVVSWAHGTTGDARVCAPSLADNPAQNFVQRSSTAPVDYGVPYLTALLARGYVVVATDYNGQGGPGVHQYVVGNSAARNVIDIVRAAATLPETHAGRTFLTFGWSQGGHAAIFTGEEQPTYAPELAHLGIVAIAPGTTAFPKPVAIPHAFALARAYQDAYHLDLSEFTDEGRKLVAVAGSTCIVGIYQASLAGKPPFVAEQWSTAFKQALALNMPAQRRSPAPILVIQGEDDNMVPPEATRQLVPRAQAIGDTISVSWYPGKNHRTVIDAAQGEILRWIDARTNE